MRLITWKFVLISFTLVDLKGQKFDSANVWKSAVRRYLSKVNSLLFTLKLQNIQEENGRRPRRRDKENKHFSPLGELEGDAITWRYDFDTTIITLGLED